MARLYSNENIPRQVVEALRTLGHEVLTSLEAGNANRSVPDEEVLAFAASRDLALLTLNRRHFVQIHNRGSQTHGGIIVCTFDPDFKALAERIDQAVRDAGVLKGLLLE